MIPRKILTTDEYLEIALRRIWYIIIPLVLAMLSATFYVILCPRTYLASTTIMVTPQKVPTDYVKPTVTTPLEYRLNSIRQEIMSRTQLEKVISEFNLYTEEAKTLFLEEIVELMQKDINLKVGGKEGYFTISYMGKEPAIVTKVTNRLASLFVEENLKQREQQAQGTTEFLSQELNATKTKLEEQEKILTDYKQKYIYEMPDRIVTNLGLLTQLRQDHQRVSGALNSAMERKLTIQKQIAEIQKQTDLLKSSFVSAPTGEVANQGALPQNTNPTSASTPASTAGSSTQIEKLRGELFALQMKYTEKHPEVINTKKAIKDLEKIVADGNKESTPRAENFDPQATFTKEMEGQLALTENEIQNLKKEESAIRANIATYHGRVENAPLREMMITNISRGYEASKENYRKLLEKSEQAQQAENLEKRQKGEQFRLIDPARVPEKPIKPNIPKVLFVTLVLGIFSGIGLAIFKEYTDRSFRDAKDMETTLGIKVLANIPRVVPKTVTDAGDMEATLGKKVLATFPRVVPKTVMQVFDLRKRNLKNE